MTVDQTQALNVVLAIGPGEGQTVTVTEAPPWWTPVPLN